MAASTLSKLNSTAILFACILAASCSSGSGDNLDDSGQPVTDAGDGDDDGTVDENGQPVTDADGDPGDDTGQPVTDVENGDVIASAFGEIQSTIFTPICSECHGPSGASAGLRLDEAEAFAAIVGVASTEVPSLMRISPNDPDNSYLVQKIEGTAAVGGRMPLGGPPLPQETIDLVRQWVTDGALPASPEALAFAPRVASVSISDNAIVDSMPNTVSIVWTSAIDSDSFNDSTVSLLGSGGDGSFSEGNEVGVGLVVAASDNPFVTTLITTDLKFSDDTFQLRVIGDGDIYARASDARAIDGDSDGIAGGNFVRDFTLENP